MVPGEAVAEPVSKAVTAVSPLDDQMPMPQMGFLS